jgi:hypothetical protein
VQGPSVQIPVLPSQKGNRLDAFTFKPCPCKKHVKDSQVVFNFRSVELGGTFWKIQEG